MGFLRSLFGRPKYWAWESDDFGFSVSTRSHSLDAHGEAHKETLLRIGPWYRREGGNDLLRALLAEKGCNALADLREQQIRKMFGRSKQDIIDTFMSGCVGTEPYMMGMMLIASKLRKKYGSLKEVHFRDDPHRIELIYRDGHRIVVTEHSGHPDVTMVNFGYSGTGTECLYAFLNESGFDVGMEQLEQMKTPFVLTR